VVSAPQGAEALAVLERICTERGSKLSVVGHDWLYHPAGHSLESQNVEVWSAAEQLQVNALRADGHAAQWRRPRFEIPLLGAFQVENAAVAYAALQTVRQQGLPIAPQALAEGFANVQWPGRFEIVQRAPMVVIDGAHNADSAARLAQAVRDYFPNRRVYLVFGASSDKDVAGMLKELLADGVGVQHVVVTQAVHPRAMEPDELAALVTAAGVSVEAVNAVAPALRRALDLAGPDDIILATGSLFVVAEARSAIQTLAAPVVENAN
jgi:dihydrofolate synthase/folylpolyglutamate synthase